MNFVNGKWTGNCPCCNHYKSLWKKSDSAGSEEAEALQKEARSIKPVERYYWNAIVRSVTNKQGSVEHNVGPKIFSTGKQVQTKLLRAMTGDELCGLEGLGDITDVSSGEGRDFQVVKRLVKGGQEEYPNYNESVFKNPSKAGSLEEVKKWLSNLHDLNSLRKLLTQDELAHEVLVHRGLVSPDSSNDKVYNESNTSSQSETYSRSTAVTKPQPAAPSVRTVTKTVVDDFDEPMADDDFLEKLKNM